MEDEHQAQDGRERVEKLQRCNPSRQGTCVSDYELVLDHDHEKAENAKERGADALNLDVLGNVVAAVDEVDAE
eukprot:1536078-Rhodomonas_salina.1